jgi:iron complex transport system ATP-binding protein
MTAVSLDRLMVCREQEEDLWVEGFFTVGVTNAVRAGEPIGLAERRCVPQGAGTINIILITNASLTVSAMITAVQVATESKTAALLEAGVPSWTGRPGATGTGTDAVVVVGGDGPFMRYSGTHTMIGALIGRLVGRAVAKAVGNPAGLLRPSSAGSLRAPARSRVSLADLTDKQYSDAE